jgi:hypothetical protein
MGREYPPASAECKACGAPLSADHTGACPQCGKSAGKLFRQAVGGGTLTPQGELRKQVRKSLGGSLGPMRALLNRRRHAFARWRYLKRILFAIDALFVVAGLFVGQWGGFALGLLGIALNHFLTPAIAGRARVTGFEQKIELGKVTAHAGPRDPKKSPQ